MYTEIDEWIVQLDTELEMCTNTSKFNDVSLQYNLDNLVATNNCLTSEYRQLVRHNCPLSEYNSCIIPEYVFFVYLQSTREQRDTRIIELEALHSELNEYEVICLGFNPTCLL